MNEISEKLVCMHGLLLQKIPDFCCYLDIPLAPFTCFAVGGNAGLLLLPRSRDELFCVLGLCEELKLPLNILGGGANVLIADSGIPGAVLCMRYLQQVLWKEPALLEAEAGWDMSALCCYSAECERSGLHFFYGMPGSLGGAVYMNARCYEGEISQIVERVLCIPRQVSQAEVPDGGGIFLHRDLRWVELAPQDWYYKYSQFQWDSGHELAGAMIIAVELQLRQQERSSLQREMQHFLEDRIVKGHYRKPCAGSFFKNNRAFGAPTGQIIDGLGLKGKCLGGAQLAPWHGNIIINAKRATALEIWQLGSLVRDQVAQSTGFLLEAEVQRLGIWSESLPNGRQ